MHSLTITLIRLTTVLVLTDQFMLILPGKQQYSQDSSTIGLQYNSQLVQLCGVLGSIWTILVCLLSQSHNENN